MHAACHLPDPARTRHFRIGILDPREITGPRSSPDVFEQIVITRILLHRVLHAADSPDPKPDVSVRAKKGQTTRQQAARPQWELEIIETEDPPIVEHDDKESEPGAFKGIL